MTDYEKALALHLQQFLTPRRRDRFARVLRQRTRHITLALTDLYQQHNSSAVLRSCDAFGIQDVHVVEMENSFETNSQIALGAERWLTLHRYRGADSLEGCLRGLRGGGYRIASTVVHQESVPLDEVPLERPLVLLFGAENDGLPEAALAQSDVLVHLPMHGFVESFNVSVAAALSLHVVTGKLRASAEPWRLSEAEQSELLLEWTRKSLPSAEAIERRFRAEWMHQRVETSTGPSMISAGRERTSSS